MYYETNSRIVILMRYHLCKIYSTDITLILDMKSKNCTVDPKSRFEISPIHRWTIHFRPLTSSFMVKPWKQNPGYDTITWLRLLETKSRTKRDTDPILGCQVRFGSYFQISHRATVPNFGIDFVSYRHMTFSSQYRLRLWWLDGALSLRAPQPMKMRRYSMPSNQSQNRFKHSIRSL